MGTVRLVQLGSGGGGERCVALVEEPRLRVLVGYASVYELAMAAIARGVSLTTLVEACATGAVVDYDAVYAGRDRWKLRVPLDHPSEAARCMVSGTGLTHLGSAKNRQKMHSVGEAEVTDSHADVSIRSRGWRGARPAAGKIGVSPEWFFKGTGGDFAGHRVRR